MRGLLESAAPASWRESCRGLGALLAVPFMFLVPDTHDVAASPAVLAMTFSVAGGAVAGGVVWIARRDFPGIS